MATSYFGRPDRMLRGTAANTAGSVNAAGGYIVDYVGDSDPWRPTMWTTTSAGASITGSATSINAVVLANTNLDGGLTVTVGGVASSFTTPTARPNGVPWNGFSRGVTVSATSISFSVSGNSAAVRVGEFIGVLLETFPRGGLLANDIGYGHSDRRLPSTAPILPRNRYRRGIAGRLFSSSVLCNDYDDADDMMAWYEAQREGSLFSVFVPNSDVNDAWLVALAEPQITYDGGYYRVQLTMEEYPRPRW
jgi:hypothetical protein